jgi:hypothetical protein
VEEIEDFWIVELVSSSFAVGTGGVIWGRGGSTTTPIGVRSIFYFGGPIPLKPKLEQQH